MLAEQKPLRQNLRGFCSQDYVLTPPEYANIMLMAMIIARRDQAHLMAVFVFLWNKKLMV